MQCFPRLHHSALGLVLLCLLLGSVRANSRAQKRTLLKLLEELIEKRGLNQDGGVNEEMQNIIVSEHNKYRRIVNPAATNMQQMYWDNEIAAIAQTWTNSCPSGHDSNDARKVPGYGIHIGQNWARGFQTWEAAVKAWYDEEKLYQYGKDPESYLEKGASAIGHYTQVVRDVAARIGCGYSNCPHLGNVYICNYAFGNPLDWGKPYEKGLMCGTCPKSCKNGLCDCQGKICKNGGTLDANMCNCNCPDLWKGDACETLSCPASDPIICGADWGFSVHHCTLYTNVPGQCPYMCGVCPADDAPGPNSVLPSGNEASQASEASQVTDANQATEATTKAPTTSLPTCSAIDPAYCGKPQPYGFLPEHCKKWRNVAGECPAMCGTCEARCDGKSSAICKYGGVLNGDTCDCECRALYSGKTCETLVSCPPADLRRCAYKQYGYSVSKCEVNPYVRESCPVMCGLCEEKCPGLMADTCKNRGTLLDDCTCACTTRYTGGRCEKFVTCPRKSDKFWCKRFPVESCNKYYNFITDCPYMCQAC